MRTVGLMTLKSSFLEVIVLLKSYLNRGSTGESNVPNIWDPQPMNKTLLFLYAQNHKMLLQRIIYIFTIQLFLKIALGLPIERKDLLFLTNVGQSQRKFEKPQAFTCSNQFAKVLFGICLLLRL